MRLSPTVGILSTRKLLRKIKHLTQTESYQVSRKKHTVTYPKGGLFRGDRYTLLDTDFSWQGTRLISIPTFGCKVFAA